VAQLRRDVSLGPNRAGREEENKGGTRGYTPGPRVERAALGVRVDVRRHLDARRERAALAVLLPPRVVGAVHGALVVAGRHLAVLGLAAGAVILGSPSVLLHVIAY
jgi:hypothetical protein